MHPTSCTSKVNRSGQTELAGPGKTTLRCRRVKFGRDRVVIVSSVLMSFKHSSTGPENTAKRHLCIRPTVWPIAPAEPVADMVCSPAFQAVWQKIRRKAAASGNTRSTVLLKGAGRYSTSVVEPTMALVHRAGLEQPPRHPERRLRPERRPARRPRQARR